MDVVTIGETMAMFSPTATGKMRYASQYSRKFAGAETNVAIGLRRLGYQTGWISKVGSDEFGKALVAFVRGEGVDVSQVQEDNQAPTGLYFKEIRNEQEVYVYYYRAGSAASKMAPSDIKEAYIAQAAYLHVTGITPALSDTCFEAVQQAIAYAKQHQVQVIFDPNIREKLWDSKEQAKERLLQIASQADIVLPGVSEARYLFGESSLAGYAQQFLKNGTKLVILKEGSKGAHFFTNDRSGFVPSYPIERVVDPIGAGDGFAAGVISGLLEALSLEEAVARGNAIGAIVTTVNGDVEGLPDREELTRFIQAEKGDVDR
ncbi:sugar kinase [Gracilibacillus alcaliphilus]|uniref:sugar kinase n=1 Tax=Gracilibacillus alcaliphilus TaxID=1401441 RepID=UPI00195AC858|nr:sugar kinase [Gracilibacillus alcaliphilus]MBM7679707.1 2-dehydro-3-deoxygluconokinase [Gracilibacillus alcaliphilus]